MNDEDEGDLGAELAKLQQEHRDLDAAIDAFASIAVVNHRRRHLPFLYAGRALRVAAGDPRPDLILLDIWMPDTDGISLLKEWSVDGQVDVPVVMMSGHGTVETAVEATHLGAFDFIEKPLEVPRLRIVLERALEKKETMLEVQLLRRRLAALTRRQLET